MGYRLWSMVGVRVGNQFHSVLYNKREIVISTRRQSTVHDMQHPCSSLTPSGASRVIAAYSASASQCLCLTIVFLLPVLLLLVLITAPLQPQCPAPAPEHSKATTDHAVDSVLILAVFVPRGYTVFVGRFVMTWLPFHGLATGTTISSSTSSAALTAWTMSDPWTLPQSYILVSVCADMDTSHSGSLTVSTMMPVIWYGSAFDAGLRSSK